jgi:hypothetical protein
MSGQDWIRHDHVPAPRTHPPRPETILWTLAKNGRTATAATRSHPKGLELVFRVNGELLWSEAFTAEDPALTRLADRKRRDFEARGWLEAS